MIDFKIEKEYLKTESFFLEFIEELLRNILIKKIVKL
jgi:hypothetical protein